MRTSTRDPGKFQAEAVCFFFVKKSVTFNCSLDLHFYTLIIGFFRSALVWLRIEERMPRLVSRVDVGFDQWSVVSFVIKKFFVY